jgi:integrase/recombinase XerD
MQERDYALLRFLESTGARLGGVAGLLLDDLALDEPEPRNRRAIVREKFDEERPVYMTPTALEAMQGWLAVRTAIADEHVFLGKVNGGEWQALGESGIYQVVKRFAILAGVKKNFSPHQWRHRFGRLLAQQGMSLGVIAQLMGHKNVSVTDRYYGQFADDERQREYDRHMPDLG